MKYHGYIIDKLINGYYGIRNPKTEWVSEIFCPNISMAKEVIRSWEAA